MNLIRKHCGMRWPLFYFRPTCQRQYCRRLFDRTTFPPPPYWYSQYGYVSDVTNLLNSRYFRSSLIANHVVCYCARISLVGFLPFYFRVSSMVKTRNGIIIYWRVRVASNFDSSTTMKQQRKTRRKSLVVFHFLFFLRKYVEKPNGLWGLIANRIRNLDVVVMFIIRFSSSFPGG